MNEIVEEKQKADDWDCEKCLQKNKMNVKDIKSCYCNICKSKNANIELILKS